jgi:uncharacterized protein (TIRG00374 family)
VAEARAGRRFGATWLRYALWLALPLTLAWVLRDVSLDALVQSLQALSVGELLLLAAVNVLVVLAFSGRWWALLRARGQRIPYLRLSAYRLAAFAVSYFTPGTHFGGEPLQVHLVNRRHSLPVPIAAASVILDKTIEMIANFAFLAVGLAVVVRLGLQPVGSGVVLRAASLLLLVAPALYLVAAWRGKRPGTWLAARVGLRPEGTGWKAALARGLEESEREVATAAQQAPWGIVAGGAFSLLSWGLLLLEWAMALHFMEIALSGAEVVAVVTAARLALFVPLPGAAGALEASLLFALTELGASPAQALGVALIIRVRDLAFGALGLWLGGWLAGGDLRGTPARPLGGPPGEQ